MSCTLTRDQVRRVDQLATERYGLTGIVLMENAGRNAAGVIRDVFGGAGSALICCGTGNNGGDGCVIARHLHNAGWAVRLILVGAPDRCTPDTTANLGIVQAMGLAVLPGPTQAGEVAAFPSIAVDEMIVDALLGTGFRGNVRSPMAEVIQAINASASRGVVSVDVPSGLDCDTGAPSNATIRADVTVTFVARKAGFQSDTARPYIGRVEVADIGVPRELVFEVAAG